MTQKWPKFFSSNYTPPYSQASLVCKHRRTSHNDVVRSVALSLVKTSRSSFDIFLSIISFILKIQWKVIYWSVSFKWPTVMAERNHKSPKAKKKMLICSWFFKNTDKKQVSFIEKAALRFESTHYLRYNLPFLWK